MAKNCSWCGKKMGFFNCTYTYEQIGDREHFICDECSPKVSAAKDGKTTFDAIKTEQTDPELFNHYVVQIKTPEEVIQQEKEKKEQQRIKEESQQTNPLYDDIHQMAGDLRFIKNYLIFCIVVGIIFGIIWVATVL